jgi:hypothetical protein
MAGAEKDQKRREEHGIPRSSCPRGLYAAAFHEEEHAALEAAGGRGLDDEIRLLRVLVRRLVLDQEAPPGELDARVALVARYVDVLGRTMRTHAGLGESAAETTHRALQQALSELAERMGAPA